MVDTKHCTVVRRMNWSLIRTTHFILKILHTKVQDKTEKSSRSSKMMLQSLHQNKFWQFHMRHSCPIQRLTTAVDGRSARWQSCFLQTFPENRNGLGRTFPISIVCMLYLIHVSMLCMYAFFSLVLYAFIWHSASFLL